jgi:hypothetical protein
MAAASYTTDLSTLSTAQATTGWTEPGTWAAGQTPALETDYFINGTSCISKTYNATGLGGLVYTAGAGVTIPTDGAFLAWQYFSCQNALATGANGGIRLIVGSGTAAFKAWNLGGSDVHTGKLWQNLAVDPSLTADYTVGAPTATRLTFGWAANNNNPVTKGNPFAAGALRYGRCESRFNGGDLANGYATFAGYAAQNDNVSNRWGLIEAVPGGYQFKGLMVLGYTSAVDFRDSNTQILIDNTTKVSANFNRVEIRNASSRVDWTGISFLALGSVSKGRLQVVDNAIVNIDACSFTGMDTFAFLSNSSLIDTTFRRCGIVTLGGATYDGCTFDRAAGSTAVTGTPAQCALVTNTQFVSDGTGYAIEITGTAASLTLTNVGFTGYAGTNGSTGNEAVFVNIASGTVTINISGGSTPTYRTAGATVVVVSSATKTFTGLPVGTEVRVRRGSKTLAIDGNVTTGTYIYSYTPDDKPVTVQFTLPGTVFEDIVVTLNATNQELPVTSAPDPSYSAT